MAFSHNSTSSGVALKASLIDGSSDVVIGMFITLFALKFLAPDKYRPGGLILRFGLEDEIESTFSSPPVSVSSSSSSGESPSLSSLEEYI